MSIGNYFSTKAENDNYNKHKAIEYCKIENMPEAEKEEIREIYREKGFEGDLLKKVVDTISADKDRWVEVMMKQELEMQETSKLPYQTAIMTFISTSIQKL